MNQNFNQAQFEEFFKKFSITGQIHLKGSKEKGDHFDPHRNTGYVITKKNPLPVKLLFRPISASSLAYRELGLVETGAIEIMINNNDISLFRMSDKIMIKGKEYYCFNAKVGSKFQLYESQFTGYSKLVLFLRTA